MVRGFPNAAELSRGTPYVAVAQRPGFTRLTTRFPRVETELPTAPPSLTVTTAGSTATFAGTCSPDQIAGVQVGSTAWAVRCGPSDTPPSIAAALAALSGGTASGPALTLPGLSAARTGRDVPTVTPTRQQEIQVAVTVWTADPPTRDAIAGAIDAALSDTEFLDLPDGTAARIKWAGTLSNDKVQAADLFMRQLFYLVEFSTTIRAVRTPVLFPGATYAPGSLRLGALHP